MEAVLLGIGLAGTVIALLVAGWKSSRLGGFVNPLRDVTVGWESGEANLLATLRSASGGHTARVESYSRGEVETGVELVVEGLCSKVTLKRADDGSYRSEEILETGDPAFDGVIQAMGSPDQVHALLNAETRKAVQELLGGTVRLGRLLLDGGELSVEVPTTGFAGAHPGLPQAARGVAELSRHFAEPESLRQRLAANARHDPVAGIRRQNLLALVRMHPGDAFTLAELRAATRDRDAEVRLAAGIKLGPDGRDVLRALATDSVVADGCSARAIEALGEAFPVEEAQALLDSACRDPHREPRRPASLRECIALLVRHRRADATLIDALKLRHEGVQVAAARALGTMGSAAAVLPLKEAAEHHGRVVAEAARHAIAAIQSRLTGSPGELSLAEGEAGGLSLTDDVSGRVSLPDAGSRPADKHGSR